MIRLLQKDGKIVGAKQWVPSYPGAAGEGDWVDVEIHSLDEPCHPTQHELSNIYEHIKCKDCGNYYKPTRPKRTLAEELLTAYRNESLSTEPWEAVASKAKEFLLGEDKLHDVASILIGERSESYQEVQKTAQKILEYLRSQE